MFLCRYRSANGTIRLGFVHHQFVHDISDQWPDLVHLLQWSVGRVLADELVSLTRNRTPVGTVAQVHLVRPLDQQEVWAAGVTYERSRVAREEESGGSGVYDRVYTAERPEIFFKATPHRTVGPGEAVAIRKDATWNVPEPELTLVINPGLEIIGYTIGNDMSSRDIEGENPLYLPQAKVYQRCCALGPLIALRPTIPDPKNLTVSIQINRDGAICFSGSTSTSRIVRQFEHLVEFLGRDNFFPQGVFLLTGAGIVPPDDFTLAHGDQVTISIEGLGILHNTVIQGT